MYVAGRWGLVCGGMYAGVNVLSMWRCVFVCGGMCIYVGICVCMWGVCMHVEVSAYMRGMCVYMGYVYVCTCMCTYGG